VRLRLPSGKLLDFIIRHRGIEGNPEKISAITKMKAPTCIKDVQKLSGCMAALNRFISKLGERGLPFFKLLKHQEKFVWTLEVDQALAQLKDFLSKPPALIAPRKKEQLLLYLTATTHVVSIAIVVERQEVGHAYPVQCLVYFISEVMSDSKAHYQPLQELLRLCFGGGFVPGSREVTEAFWNACCAAVVATGLTGSVHRSDRCHRSDRRRPSV
jgi:hypothetical protein